MSDYIASRPGSAPRSHWVVYPLLMAFLDVDGQFCWSRETEDEVYSRLIDSAMQVRWLANEDHPMGIPALVQPRGPAAPKPYKTNGDSSAALLPSSPLLAILQGPHMLRLKW